MTPELDPYRDWIVTPTHAPKPRPTILRNMTRGQAIRHIRDVLKLVAYKIEPYERN